MRISMKLFQLLLLIAFNQLINQSIGSRKAVLLQACQTFQSKHFIVIEKLSLGFFIIKDNRIFLFLLEVCIFYFKRLGFCHLELPKHGLVHSLKIPQNSFINLMSSQKLILNFIFYVILENFHKIFAVFSHQISVE